MYIGAYIQYSGRYLVRIGRIGGRYLHGYIFRETVQTASAILTSYRAPSRSTRECGHFLA